MSEPTLRPSGSRPPSAERARIAGRSAEPGSQPDTRPPWGVFASHAMQHVLKFATRAAPSGIPVLITGESGTGKEVLARIIHDRSGRPRELFVPYNCTGTTREIFDSQLFGHRRGSFTGASDNAPGVIRSAHGGTVLLGEIGELDAHIQPTLLRLIENQEVQPIGQPRPSKVDVRILAATNADIDEMVRDKRFREDLFYRLNIIRIHIPPLREQPLPAAIAEVERALIIRALAAGGRLNAAAGRLGVSRKGLLLKRRRLNIDAFLARE